MAGHDLNWDLLQTPSRLAALRASSVDEACGRDLHA
jgi:hypothetical protein